MLVIAVIVLYSLCNQNLFWDFNNSDPHQAVSFDQLHWYHSGLFGHHLWGEFKNVIGSLPRVVGEEVDKE